MAPDAPTPRPICGTEVVTREYEGMAAEIVLCVRTGGPCPWRNAGGTYAGLRASGAETCAALREEEPPCLTHPPHQTTR